MTDHIVKPLSPQKPLSREIFLQVLESSLKVNGFRFTRDAALEWLSNYPGDLMVGWYYAQSLINDGLIKQARPILQGLCNADPEFLKAAESLLHAVQNIESSPFQETAINPMPGRLDFTRELNSYLFALNGKSMDPESVSSWGKDLWQGRQFLSDGQLDKAEESIRRALSADPPTPLAAVLHLQLLFANQNIPIEDKRKLAARYRQRWPDTLVCVLFLAEWLMDTDKSNEAVALMHQIVARDISGQVIERLWGVNQPYRSLWPERLELALQIPIPAVVAANLGWNLLPEVIHLNDPAGYHLLSSELNVSEIATSMLQSTIDEVHKDLGEDLPSLESKISPLAKPEDGSKRTTGVKQDATRLISEEELELYISHTMKSIDNGSQETSSEPFSNVLSTSSMLTEVERDSGFEVGSPKETLQLVEDEFEKLAERLQLPGLTRMDGRFPIYVVFSARGRLESFYGSNIAAVLEVEMQRLVQSIESRRGWGARLFIPDDPANLQELGLKPSRPGSAWDLKLALVDLDAVLEKRGERIGALLIVGGPEIVPYHRLPNPLDDPDVDVPSDNPYGTRDENYFFPEWPVGRLPGGCDGDARLLIGSLRRMTAYHSQRRKPIPLIKRLATWITGIISPRRRCRIGFGYTAEIWQRAAANVFHPIGEPDELLVSPPYGITGDTIDDYLDDLDFTGNSDECIPIPRGKLGYFNLHGVVSESEWFGHRDPQNLQGGSEYPIAFRPQDIHLGTNTQDSNFPTVIFSEACYGTWIEGRTSENAIALKFLEAGSLALVGSTCMSYGSIDGNLSAADLLGYCFWQNIREGFSAGEALCQAKIKLINEMNRRQGFLDGEDQKTLISFNLYGDPLTQPLQSNIRRKSIQNKNRPVNNIKIVCDRRQNPEWPQEVPDEVMEQVRQVVAQYLPGMAGAEVEYTEERQVCNGQGHSCPTSQLNKSDTFDLENPGTTDGVTNSKAHHGNDLQRKMVTLSKNVQNANGVHPYYAHLTLDPGGKLLKLVVSR
jgi:hypothetical protein